MWELGITHSKPMDTKVLQHLDSQQSHTGVYHLTVWWGKRHQLGIGKRTIYEHHCLLKTGDTGESRLPNPGFALHPSPAWRKLDIQFLGSGLPTTPDIDFTCSGCYHSNGCFSHSA